MRVPLTARSILFLAAVPVLVSVPAMGAKTASISGQILTIGSDRVQTTWPNARVALKNLETNRESATISDALGTYRFSGILLGRYEITVTLAGFESATRQVSIEKQGTSKIDFQLKPKGQTETVTVTAEEPGVNLNSSYGGAPSLNENTLKSVVQLNQDFQDALPLLPGVVRGLDGLIRIKGGRTNQTNTLVNSASVTDPFTGQAALSLPVVAVKSVRVLANPFS